LTTYLSAIFQFSDCLRRRPICCPSQVDEEIVSLQWAGLAYYKMSNLITKGSRLADRTGNAGLTSSDASTYSPNAHVEPVSPKAPQNLEIIHLCPSCL